MKRLRNWPVLGALAFVLAMGFAGPSARLSASVGWSVSFSSFHGSLAPYGTWVTVGNHGQCWRPARVSAGWQPYSNGEWVDTDYGWTWVSYDPWGGIPYHYGTWVDEPGYGWVWVPGYVWAPAWVTWCHTDDFIGWAPLSPGFVLTTSGYFGRPIVGSTSSYVFVPTNRFVGVNAWTARVSSTQNATLLRSGTKTTRFSVANGVVRTNGPDPRRIERVTHRAIRPTSIATAKLHPTRIDAGGRIRGSRLAVTSRIGENPGPGEPKTTRLTTNRRAPMSARGTVTRAHESRHAAPRTSSGSTATAHRASPQVHAAPKHVVARTVPTAHPKKITTTRRNVEPRKQSLPQTHVVTTHRREAGSAPARVVTRQATPKRVHPSPVVTRERPVVHAAPQVQAHAAPAPRVESRPASSPRVEARHAQPAPRASRKEDGR